MAMSIKLRTTKDSRLARKRIASSSLTLARHEGHLGGRTARMICPLLDAISTPMSKNLINRLTQQKTSIKMTVYLQTKRNRKKLVEKLQGLLKNSPMLAYLGTYWKH